MLCRDRPPIDTAAYLAKKTRQTLLDSNDSEGEKEHGSESRIQKIFTFNFNCVILAFSVMCVSVNVIQMRNLREDKRIVEAGHYAHTINPVV